MILKAYTHLAAKYLWKSFSLFDEKTGVLHSAQSAFDSLEQRFTEVFGGADGVEEESCGNTFSEKAHDGKGGG